jgi:hypothetical protein
MKEGEWKRGGRCTYNQLSLHGLLLLGVLTLNSNSVLDSSTGLSGQGTKVTSASTTSGGGHLVVGSVSLSILNKRDRREGTRRDTDLVASVCELASSNGTNVVWAWLAASGIAGTRCRADVSYSATTRRLGGNGQGWAGGDEGARLT